MQSMLKITFRDVSPSPAIDGYVRRRASKLLAASERLVACHVAIESPHRRRHHGRHFRVRLDLMVPGGAVIVDRCPDESRTCEDVYAAIDLAFDHAVRRLRETKLRRATS